MSIFVLVHGAWHGAWCWEKLIPILENQGHKVIAKDLPGLGEHTTKIENINLLSYVDSIINTINKIDEKVILLGHSMGGIVISQVAERIPNKISALVYLCAFMPKNNQSLMDIVKYQPQTHLELEFSQDYSYATVKEDSIETAFFNTCNPEDIITAKKLLRPQHMNVFQEKVTLTDKNYGQVPRIYIECLQDNVILIATQRAMIREQPVAKTYTIDSDHSPFLSNPILLGRILNEISLSNQI